MCSCGRNRERWTVTLASGMTLTKSGPESAIKAFVKRHPNSTYVKKA